MFKDRLQAARLLAERLLRYRGVSLRHGYRTKGTTQALGHFLIQIRRYHTAYVLGLENRMIYIHISSQIKESILFLIG
jgi:hypothetical protein